MADKPKTWAEMWSEAVIEIGILFFVFGLLDVALDKSVRDDDALLAAAIILFTLFPLVLILVGMGIERWRAH